MTTWVLLAIAAQFLYAISVLIDRHIVVRAQHIGRPIAYAFYVSLLSGFVIVLAPTGFVHSPDARILTLSLVNAGAFVAGIFFLYTALRLARASDVAPVVGAVSAVTTLILAGLFLEGDVAAEFVFPVLLLAAGTALISHFHFSRRAAAAALIAGFFFGLTAFAFKLVVLATPFLDAFFWTRAMNALLALALLIVPSWRSVIFHGGRRATPGARGLVIGNKILGGVAAALTALAISLGSVSVVNALSGLQFAFLFLFAFLFSEISHERAKRGNYGGAASAAGVILIAAGLALLYVGESL